MLVIGSGNYFPNILMIDPWLSKLMNKRVNKPKFCYYCAFRYYHIEIPESVKQNFWNCILFNIKLIILSWLFPKPWFVILAELDLMKRLYVSFCKVTLSIFYYFWAAFLWYLVDNDRGYHRKAVKLIYCYW